MSCVSVEPLSRSFQKASSRRLEWMHRKARMFSAPSRPQNISDCLHWEPMTALHPVSTTPESINEPWLAL